MLKPGKDKEACGRDFIANCAFEVPSGALKPRYDLRLKCVTLRLGCDWIGYRIPRSRDIKSQFAPSLSRVNSLQLNISPGRFGLPF